jgi:Rrf2 family protein
VDVTLSKRGSYAAAAAICLARAYPTGRPKKLREISAEMDIPRTYVPQILGDLVHAGIAVSSAGRDGGHRLAREPSQVSVAEVIEAAEGPLASERCALGDGPCRWQAVCPMHETITAATASLRQVLDSTTLATLAERDAAIASGTYPLPPDAHRHRSAVTIADTVQIELPTPVIAARLGAGTSWLTAHAEACDIEELRIRVGPGWPGTTVAVYLGQAARADEDLVIPLIWEASGPAGIFPRFEGEFRLSPVDPERSELRLSGRYRPPIAQAGQALNDTSLTRLARATLRSFLRRIAQGLEHEYSGSHPAPRPRAAEPPGSRSAAAT